MSDFKRKPFRDTFYGQYINDLERMVRRLYAERSILKMQLAMKEEEKENKEEKIINVTNSVL